MARVIDLPTFRGTWTLEYEPYVIYYSTDRSGLKKNDKYLQYAEKRENYRVLVIGGSTAAFMPNQLVAEAVREIAGREPEVINLADGGYIVNQNLVMLAVHGVKLAPDLIISLDGFNDLINTTKGGVPGIHYQADYVRFAVEHPVLNGFRSLLNHSQFVFGVLRLQERRRMWDRLNDDRLLQETVDAYIQTLKATSVLAEGIGASYVPVLQPYVLLRKTAMENERIMERPWQYRTDFMQEGFRRIERAMVDERWPPGTHFVSALAAFDEIETQAFTDACHLTPEGMRVLLGYVLNEACKHGLKLDTQHKYGGYAADDRAVP